MNDVLSTLERLEAEIHHPGTRITHERLEALLHPDFHEVGRSGRPYTRAFVIHFLVAQTAIPDVLPSDHRLQMLAPGVALLTYRTVQRQADGALVNAALRSSVWLQEGSRWRLLYHQGTPEDASGA